MKKSLKLIIMYFTFIIISAIISTIFYSFYMNVTNYVAGTKFQASAIKILTYSFFSVFPYLFIFVCPILSYYRIRHIGKFWQILIYIFICLINWLLFYPLSIKASTAYFNSNRTVLSSNILSGNYFRKSGDKVYYFTEDYDSSSYKEMTSGIIIDTTQDGKVEPAYFGYSSDFILQKEAAPYKDILIKKTFDSKINTGRIKINTITNRTELAYNKGITFIIGFMLFAFAVSALFACTNIFNWKLINTTLLVLLTTVIVSINLLYYSPAFDGFKNRFIYSSNFFRFLENYAEAPFLNLINLVFGIILILISVISTIIKKHSIDN